MKRQVLGEEYFTPPSLAASCVDLVDTHFPLSEFGSVVEPSAGSGAFYELLPPDSRIGIDIAPKHPDVLESDFLDWAPSPGHDRILTIGNPPFGQRAAIAVRFLEHACKFSDVVAFILPRSFKKYTFQNRVPRYFHLVDSLDCEEFVGPNGGPVSVKAVFQIWERRSYHRRIEMLPDSHPDFRMKHGHLSRLTAEQLLDLRANFEFTIPQVGSDFRPRDVMAVSRGSHWFIQPMVPGVRARFEELDFSFLENMNTAHTSLSKRDIIAAYIAATGRDPSMPSKQEELPLSG